MKRSHVDRGRDRRIFTKTADDVHWVNFAYVRPQRGGRRM